MAISRAYCAAFHVARELLEDLRFTVPHADRAHAYLSRRLANCGQARTQQGGAGLKALCGVRNQADYDLHRSVTSQRLADGPTLFTELPECSDDSLESI
jgi:hypothetical protein